MSKMHLSFHNKKMNGDSADVRDIDSEMKVSNLNSSVGSMSYKKRQHLKVKKSKAEEGFIGNMLTKLCV